MSSRTVVLSIYLTNRDPKVYEAPEEFRPERFMENQPETLQTVAAIRRASERRSRRSRRS